MAQKVNEISSDFHKKIIDRTAERAKNSDSFDRYGGALDPQGRRYSERLMKARRNNEKLRRAEETGADKAEQIWKANNLAQQEPQWDTETHIGTIKFGGYTFTFKGYGNPLRLTGYEDINFTSPDGKSGTFLWSTGKYHSYENSSKTARTSQRYSGEELAKNRELESRDTEKKARQIWYENNLEDEIEWGDNEWADDETYGPCTGEVDFEGWQFIVNGSVDGPHCTPEIESDYIEYTAPFGTWGSFLDDGQYEPSEEDDEDYEDDVDTESINESIKKMKSLMERMNKVDHGKGSILL